MPRGANFYYSGDSQLGPAIGALVSRALFGDPEMRMQAELRRAQMDNYAASAEEARAHAGLYGAQATDQGVRTGYRQQFGPLGDAILSMTAPPPAVPVEHPAGFDPADPLAPLPAPPQVDSDGLARAMIPLIMAAGGAQENPNIGDVVGATTAMLGNDELARRGMVAQGVTPGKDFALTPERADDIAQAGYDADFRKGTEVARINHATDIPIANIQAATTRRGQDISAATQRRGQDIRSLGKTVGFGLVSDVLPGAVETGGERSPEHNAQVGGVGDSYHLPGDGVEAYDIRVGTGARTFADAKRAMQARYGDRLVEAIDESQHTNGTGPHWHFAIRTDGKMSKQAATKAPKQISAATATAIDGEIDRQLASRGWNAQGKARDNIRVSAQKNYQRGGNIAGAVSDALDFIQRRMDSQRAGGASPDQLRQQAIAAIRQGADPAKVKARFRSMTGKDLAGV